MRDDGSTHRLQDRAGAKHVLFRVVSAIRVVPRGLIDPCYNVETIIRPGEPTSSLSTGFDGDSCGIGAVSSGSRALRASRAATILHFRDPVRA